MLKSLFFLLVSANAISLDKVDPSTGAVINICNGANAGNCVTAEEVNTKKLRRPYKRAAPGDPDYEAQEKADAARKPVITGVLAQKNDGTQKKLPTCDKFTTTNCQPVCSETLTVGCTEARTPNAPDPLRYGGLGTYNYETGTVIASQKK